MSVMPVECHEELLGMQADFPGQLIPIQAPEICVSLFLMWFGLLFCVTTISVFSFFLKLFASRVTKEGFFMISASLILQPLCKKGLKISGSC